VLQALCEVRGLGKISATGNKSLSLRVIGKPATSIDQQFMR